MILPVLNDILQALQQDRTLRPPVHQNYVEHAVGQAAWPAYLTEEWDQQDEYRGVRFGYRDS